MRELSATTTRVLEFPALESLEISVIGLDTGFTNGCSTLSSLWSNQGLGRRCIQGLSHGFGECLYYRGGGAQGGGSSEQLCLTLAYLAILLKSIGLNSTS